MGATRQLFGAVILNNEAMNKALVKIVILIWSMVFFYSPIFSENKRKKNVKNADLESYLDWFNSRENLLNSGMLIA